MDTEVATSYCTTKKTNVIYHILNTRIRTPHGSMDTKMVTSYCTTNKAIVIFFDPPRKYGHRGGNLILHN